MQKKQRPKGCLGHYIKPCSGRKVFQSLLSWRWPDRGIRSMGSHGQQRNGTLVPSSCEPASAPSLTPLGAWPRTYITECTATNIHCTVQTVPMLCDLCSAQSLFSKTTTKQQKWVCSTKVHQLGNKSEHSAAEAAPQHQVRGAGQDWWQLDVALTVSNKVRCKNHSKNRVRRNRTQRQD